MADEVPVLVEPHQVIVGPPPPGCPECLRTRRLAAAGPDEAALIDTAAASSLTTFAADLVIALTDAATDPTRCWIVDTGSFHTSRHAFLPDPRCTTCSSAPPDSAGAAIVLPRRRPKLSPGSSRVRELDGPALAKTYVDGRAGLITAVNSYTQHAFPFSEAVLAVPGEEPATGHGRTRDFASAWRISVVEALERSAAYGPSAKRTSVVASYDEVRDHALDPRSFGLYPPDRYRTPGFPYRPFTEDAVTSWVWGYSFSRQCPVLVPEGHVYYRMPRPPDDRRFAAEISSGCALGGCYEEAVLHGLLEIAERDAFLLAWYGRLPLPEIDLDTVEDDRIALVAERIALRGHRVRVFDTTREHGVPSFWALAEDVVGGDRPKTASTGGSGLDPAEAVLAALHELCQTVEYVALMALDPGWLDRARRLADNPAEVTTMADHLLCAANPGTVDRFSFLLDGARTVPWQQARRRWDWPANDDIGTDLAEAVTRFADAGLEVVAVDMTSAEHRAGEFRCVKVIVPGSVPMTFGHSSRRVTGLPRLPEVRNPFPHPFP
ncbi:MAG TPA: TOMM precursor leader peptide-binding protein [Kutzneria sp.]|nr:TOMM precursor leader peptide-binding protein [Kutzneria sp.]